MVDERLIALRDEQTLRECGIDVPLVVDPRREKEETDIRAVWLSMWLGVAAWVALVVAIARRWFT